MASSHPATEVPDRLPTKPSPKAPTLRFIYRPRGEHTNPLITVPYGYTTFLVSEEDLDSAVVVGEIRAWPERRESVKRRWIAEMEGSKNGNRR